jgi:hypothetical protein
VPDKTTKSKLGVLNAREEKILHLLRDERTRAKERFPLLYAMLATFGLVCTLGGFSKFIENITWLNENPLYLTGLGLVILLLTGAAYRKLS